LIYVSFFPELIQIWSSSSSPSSDYEKRQTIELPFSICSFCQITENNNDPKVEFTRGSGNGEIQIWSKEINSNSSDYSHIKTLKFYNHFIPDLIFIGGEFNFLISCCTDKSNIFLYRKKKTKEELQYDGVSRLIHLSNGIFASGAENGLLKIWSPSSISSSSPKILS
jgi:hypothetical protein